MNDSIDIVIPWVDGSDPVWLAEKEKYWRMYYPDEQANSDIRYQNWDNLHYWFRTVEKFMPWVNKIFFITWGHVPEFLNKDNPKLKIVKHSDYIPEEYLPTFNSSTIEMNVHRIADLSENYIMFNDDTFPLQNIEETYYFEDNVVCDEAVENIIVTKCFGNIANMARYMQVNNMMIINKYFNKREVQERDWDKWYCDDYGELLERTKSLNYWYDFPGFHDPHMANALKKSILEKLWELEKETLNRASLNKFRGCSDVNQYLIRYWQLCTGRFIPRKTKGKMCLVDMNNYEEISQEIENQKWQMISLNENCTANEFNIIKKKINNAFQQILPQKSSFEN